MASHPTISVGARRSPRTGKTRVKHASMEPKKPERHTPRESQTRHQPHSRHQLCDKHQQPTKHHQHDKNKWNDQKHEGDPIMQQPMPHQLMGYDRAITMFSPDGRLLQVEYAKKTVKQGSTTLGMVCSDGILFVADKRIVDKFVIPESVEKVFEIDEHLGAAASGILSDARVLIERAQVKAQQHRVQFDSEIDSVSVVKEICNLMQICTQSGGLRPFGVSVILGGVDPDGEARLFETDPTGIFFQYKATVIGEGEAEIEEILQKEYNEKITIEEGLGIAMRALNKLLEKRLNLERIEAACIRKSDRKFTKLSPDDIEKALKKK